MARPIKNNADYFSHDNDMRDDERIKAVRRKFSHLGYSTWNMLLEKLCRAENFKAEYNEESLDIMAGDFNIEPEQLKEIIEYLIRLKLIIQEKEIIFSPTMITRFEGLFRKRKRDSEKLSLTITQNESIIADENTQSKVNNSKGNKSKENKSKEKGDREFEPPIFFKNFSEKEISEKAIQEKNIQEKNQDTQTQKEKSCEKKEAITSEAIAECKNIFLQQAPFYAWESKDHTQLVFILQKIIQTKKTIQNEKELIDSFGNFLFKLPEYWRTKKFTLPNLNFNFNEIVNEISSHKKNLKEKNQAKINKMNVTQRLEVKGEPTVEEKIKLRENFIKSICECYENFVETGEYGHLPKRVMYQTLIDEKVLKLSEKKLQGYRNKALQTRKEELSNPQNPHEEQKFKEILEQLNKNILEGNEKIKIETAIKNQAVQALFEELKKKKLDIKSLFKK